MDGTRLARRYLPLAVAIALQAIIIVVVPSTAPTTLAGGTGTGAYSAAGNVGSASAAGATGATGGGGATAVGGTGSTTAAGTSTGGAAGTSTGSAPGANGAVTPPGTSAGGSTAHCVGGRNFDPAIDYYAPPCVPTFSGNNGGATSRGVSANKIELVWYYSDYGAEVDAILKAEGLYVTYAQQQAYDAAVQKFINSHYELYGRQVHIDTYQGTCTTVPPDENCLIPEMDKIAQSYKPYAVIWDTTLCSDCFKELSRQGVVNLGGNGFSEQFNDANAPYHWDVLMNGTRMAQLFAKFWCSQLSSSNANRTVAYAGTQNPAQNFNGKPRELGVISTNDPDNEYTVKNVLYPALSKGCHEKDLGKHEYYYAQDINTAAQQVAAGIAAMDTPQNPATSVLCLCDPVAPAFLYEGEQNNNYYPENLIATTQSMDTDKTGQSYTAPNGLACPAPQNGCEYDLAFGLSEIGGDQPLNNDAGTRVWHLGGGTGPTQFPSDTATSEWEYFNMLMTMIQMTGPDLTPANMQQAAYRIPAIGGGATGHYQVGPLAPDNHAWMTDVRVVYWDKHKTSSVNGQPGTYVQIEGDRKSLAGGFPTMSNPVMPVSGRH